MTSAIRPPGMLDFGLGDDAHRTSSDPSSMMRAPSLNSQTNTPGTQTRRTYGQTTRPPAGTYEQTDHAAGLGRNRRRAPVPGPDAIHQCRGPDLISRESHETAVRPAARKCSCRITNSTLTESGGSVLRTRPRAKAAGLRRSRHSTGRASISGAARAETARRSGPASLRGHREEVQRGRQIGDTRMHQLLHSDLHDADVHRGRRGGLLQACARSRNTDATSGTGGDRAASALPGAGSP